MTKKILRLTSVIERTGCSRSTIYSMISIGKFPNSIKIGSRSVGWLESEINDWIEQCALKSKKNREVKQ